MSADLPVRRTEQSSPSDVRPGYWQVGAADLADASPGLVSGPLGHLRRLALEVACAGLASADPGAATKRIVSYLPDSDAVIVGSTEFRLSASARLWVIGAGKASYGVARALEEILGDRITGGVVAVRDPNVPTLRHVDVLCSDHPLPTLRSVEAATEILSVARAAREGDLVLTCFTGGSSALASLPPPGVSVADKRALHKLLLSSGLAITDINAVRKAVSDFKGGRVALAAAPATVVNLTVSDVAGSPLDAITDPTVQDSSTPGYARSVAVSSGLWKSLPTSVRSHIDTDASTPVLSREPQTVILADGGSTVSTMAETGRNMGFDVIVVNPELEGEADQVASLLTQRLLDELDRMNGSSVMIVGCGGESVVTITDPGAFSMGGPNQHAALCAATFLQGRRAAALFIDTDGSDGGTELAGALIDGHTMSLADARGVDVVGLLANRRSSEACRELDVAVQTGHTGTNVNDLFVLIAETGGL